MRLIKEIYRDKDINVLGKQIYREAVRGIIKRGNKILMIYSSKQGDYSFPGGGVDIGETYQEALLREVREECGARVTNICSDFGKMVEYAIPIESEYDVFKMTSYYFICEVDQIFEEQKLEEYEKELGFEPVWIDIDTAIEANLDIINNKVTDAPKRTQREVTILKLVKTHYNDTSQV